MKVKSVSRLSKPFEGVDAIAEWHKNRTKSSMAEAFKGADYAIAIESPPSEWRDFWEFACGLAVISPFIFVGLYVGYLVLKALGIVVVL